ncbi:hypothetical protein TNCV_3644941 [Trichonephila clavipes]|nr:hypothetical protein TNCV_3644941 [Trichonephila clavipes]
MLRRLVGTTAPGHHDQFRNEKVSNPGSIPITIDCNVVAFIVFEEGFHQPIKRTKHYVRSSLYTAEAWWKNYVECNPQQPMRAKVYCTHLLTIGRLGALADVPDKVVSLKRNPQCLVPKQPWYSFIDPLKG